MTFAVGLALAVAAFVVVPFVAHLLRRSRADEREFPPAHLVPVVEPVARQRSRLEDRVLFGVRAAMILALAVLGATPLVRCSRLSIARQSGGSVALAIVVDDSLSMRSLTPSGKSRFDLARGGARELLAAAREGDAVAVILAGAPARVALSATTDLGAARRVIAELEVTDRPTDLAAAVQLGRSAVKPLPHVDRKVVLLSDFAGAPVPNGEPAVWAPMAELRKAMDDCAVVSAVSHGRRVSATVACSSAQAARGRSLDLAVSTQAATAPDAGAPLAKTGEVVASAKLDPRAGEQTVSLEPSTLGAGLDAQLSGKDSIAEDDRAPVAPEAQGLGVAVISDVATSSATTGGATVVEQALEALALDVGVKPLPTLPDDAKELERFAALVLDDPGGLTPEARAALGEWLERGGVALGLLGPRAESVQLGTTLEPFVSGALSWGTTKSGGVDPKSIAWLGAPGASLSSLAPRGRVRLESALAPGATVLARWDDGEPFMVEKRVGRGLTLTVSLPSAPDHSDLALRPGFLALLEHVIEQSERRAGPRRSVAGTPWAFPAGSRVEIDGPRGPLARETASGAETERAFVPSRVGRYRVRVEGTTEQRIVTLDPAEITTAPHEPDQHDERVVTSGVDNQVDASSEVALALLALLALELVLRATRRLAPRRNRRRADRPSALAS
ncbi:MAG: VWA domain-containing protein [Polyangiaceae bacterium]|nr:VWA domain-containing protein [Polyangiaceae bacterium]